MLSRLLPLLETRRGFVLGVAGLAGLSALLRWIRITVPSERVFDEVYSPLFAWKLLQGKDFFDVHPILAQLGQVPGLLLFGDTPLGWRFSAWLWGVFFLLGIGALAYFLTGRRTAGVLAAFLAAFDVALFVYGRTGLPDMFLLATFVWALALFFLSCRARATADAFLAALGSGVLLGNLTATKWFGIGALGLIWLWIALEAFTRLRPEAPGGSPGVAGEAGAPRSPEGEVGLASAGVAGQSDVTGGSLWSSTDTGGEDLLPRVPVGWYPVVFLAVPVLTYLLWLVPLVGIPGKLPAATGEQLYTSACTFGPTARPGAQPPTTWAGRARHWHCIVWNYHAHLDAKHPYASPWWSWPLLIHPVLFYRNDAVQPPLVISATGNPVLWWAGIATVALTAVMLLRRRVREQPRTFTRESLIDLWLILGVLGLWLPWAFIQRVTFSYHYFLSFTLSLVLLAHWLARFLDRRELRGAALAFLALVLAGFVILYPSASATPALWVR